LPIIGAVRRGGHDLRQVDTAWCRQTLACMPLSQQTAILSLARWHA